MSTAKLNPQKLFNMVEWPTENPVQELLTLRRSLVRTLVYWVNTGHTTDEIERSYDEVLADIRTLLNPSNITSIRKVNIVTNQGVGGYDRVDFFSKEHQTSVKREMQAVLTAINQCIGTAFKNISDLHEEYPYDIQHDDDFEEDVWDMY